MSDYIYKASNNQEMACIPGVPLRDISAAEFDAYPPHIQSAIVRAKFYSKKVNRKSAVEPEPKAETATSGE